MRIELRDSNVTIFLNDRLIIAPVVAWDSEEGWVEIVDVEKLTELSLVDTQNVDFSLPKPMDKQEIPTRRLHGKIKAVASPENS